MMKIRDYIGIPYKNKGFSIDGFDCFGFFVHFEKEMYNRIIPFVDYRHSGEKYFNKTYLLVLKELAKDKHWIKVDKAENKGDAIIFFENGKGVHIGVYLGQGEFIHCDNLGVRVSNLDTYFRKERWYYTWQE